MVFKRGAYCAPLDTGDKKKPGLDRVKDKNLAYNSLHFKGQISVGVFGTTYFAASSSFDPRMRALTVSLRQVQS